MAEQGRSVHFRQKLQGKMYLDLIFEPVFARIQYPSIIVEIKRVSLAGWRKGEYLEGKKSWHSRAEQAHYGVCMASKVSTPADWACGGEAGLVCMGLGRKQMDRDFTSA